MITNFKIYEKSGKDILDDYVDKKMKYLSVREDILILVNEYFDCNVQYFFNKCGFERSYMSIEDFDVVMLNDGGKTIHIKTDSTKCSDFYLNKKEFDDFQKFLDDPYLYKTTKTYNL